MILGFERLIKKNTKFKPIVSQIIIDSRFRSYTETAGATDDDGAVATVTYAVGRS